MLYNSGHLGSATTMGGVCDARQVGLGMISLWARERQFPGTAETDVLCLVVVKGVKHHTRVNNTRCLTALHHSQQY